MYNQYNNIKTPININADNILIHFVNPIPLVSLVYIGGKTKP